MDRGRLLPREFHGVVRKRAIQAGLPGVTYTFTWSVAAVREMLDRYGAAVADRRAGDAYMR